MTWSKPEDFPTYEEWLGTIPDPDRQPSLTNGFTIDSGWEGNYPSRKWWQHHTSEDYLSGKHENKATATRWCLHLNVPQTQDVPVVPTEYVQTLATLIMLTGCEALTGEYLGGDSFWQWAEEYDPDDEREVGRALHVYYVAPDVDAAGDVAAGICERLGGVYLDAHYVCYSTGGDWAEQEEVWDRNVPQTQTG